MDEMEKTKAPFLMDKICRSCMNESNEMQSLFTRMEMAGLETQVSEMLMACASVQVASGDGLPDSICRPCVHQLSNAYTFKQQCESTDIKLRQYISTLTEELKIKEEKNEADSFSIVVKPDIDMGVMDDIYDDNNFQNDWNDSDDEKLKKISKKSPNECKICFKKVSTKGGLKLHMRKHEKEKNDKHICEMCGVVFDKLGQLKKHRLEHHPNGDGGEKNHILGNDKILNSIKNEELKEEVLEEDDDDRNDPDFEIEVNKSRSTKKRDDLGEYECNECHKVLSSYKGLQIHKKRHTGEGLNQCYLCVKTFLKFSHLKRHLLTHGLSTSAIEEIKNENKGKMFLQCEYCDRKFVYRKSFTHHMKTEHAISEEEAQLHGELIIKNEEILKDENNENNGHLPDDTDMNLEEQNELVDQENEEEEDGQEYECHVCNHKFSRANHLTRHMTLHRNVLTHKCDHCEKAYLTEEHLQKHIEEHHVQKSYFCTLCNIPFMRGEHLIRHLKTEHIPEEISEFKCSVCDKVFNTGSLLAKHTKQHLMKDKKHICDVCNKAFSRLDNLKTHQRIHSRIKDPVRLHLCIYCGKEFNNSSNMIVHMRRHTGERPYKCQVCGKGFPRSHDLKCHERIHSGERPYLCTLCGKSFNKSNKLVRHTRVHTGERPYVCNLCGRAFTQSNDLALHMRRHTGSRPYACGVCPARFIQSGQLKAHRRSQGHWVEQEIQFRGNRVEPVHVENLVETPIKHRKSRTNQNSNNNNSNNTTSSVNQIIIRDLSLLTNNRESSTGTFAPLTTSTTNGITITALREAVTSRPVTSDTETFQISTPFSTQTSVATTTSTSFTSNDNFSFQQFG